MCLQRMHYANDPPVKISLLIISIMELTIDRALPAIRQQLEKAKIAALILACTSTAPQLNLAGWAWGKGKALKYELYAICIDWLVCTMVMTTMIDNFLFFIMF